MWMNITIIKRPVRLHKNIRVIAMGNQMRNLKLLKTIVDNNPNVNFYHLPRGK